MYGNQSKESTGRVYSKNTFVFFAKAVRVRNLETWKLLAKWDILDTGSMGEEDEELGEYRFDIVDVGHQWEVFSANVICGPSTGGIWEPKICNVNWAKLSHRPKPIFLLDIVG